MKSIAIVTGASSGVGQEFLRQLTEGKGGPLDEIWAIARKTEQLEMLAAAIPAPTIRPLSLDLTRNESFESFAALLDAEQPCVQWLINCAGFGTFGNYDAVGRTNNANMVRLNCLAPVELMSAALPHMRPGSRIINLASIAGAVPQVQLATYSATKAFVLELSRMIDHELAPVGIRVTAVCPKFMRTRFLNKPGNEQVAQRMCAIGFEDVERVVTKALRASLMGRAVCISSLDMKAASLSAKLLPRKLLFRIEDFLFRS